MEFMSQEIDQYHAMQSSDDQEICRLLRQELDRGVPEATSKLWHGSPVWFLEGNPIAGYCRLKDSVQLLFWSGQSFQREGLDPVGKYKAA